jgi:hypothetical protein
MDTIKILKLKEVTAQLDNPGGLVQLSLRKANLSVYDEDVTGLSPEIHLDLTGNRVECSQCRILGMKKLDIDFCFGGKLAAVINVSMI